MANGKVLINGVSQKTCQRNLNNHSALGRRAGGVKAKGLLYFLFYHLPEAVTTKIFQKK